MDIDAIIESFEKAEDTLQEAVGNEPIVFIHDSRVRQRGQVFSFFDDEYDAIMALLKKSNLPLEECQFIAAIKQLGVSEKDVTTEIIHANRPLLEQDLKEAKPKLVFVLGNLAMKTLLRKSGITNKRGKEFWIELDDQEIPVVPLFHPFSVYTEPKLRGLFIQDVDNSYDKFILGKNKLGNSSYNLHNDLPSALEAIKEATQKEVVAIDIETTGLDYKKDKITTFGLSLGEHKAFVIPINHRESELSESDLNTIRDSLADLLANQSVAKVFHNCKFDLKFLQNWGIDKFSNIHDTQIMHALVDENLPHGLMDLVKEYFPHELEKF